MREFEVPVPTLGVQERIAEILSTYDDLIENNRRRIELLEQSALLLDGVQVSYTDNEGQRMKKRLRVFDFNDHTQNDFLRVRELWIRGDLYRKRADVIGFVNGIPLLFCECKIADINQWQQRESTRDAVRLTIHDYLWSDGTRLPSDSYDESDIEEKTDAVFQHVYRAYPRVPSPIYDTQTA